MALVSVLWVSGILAQIDDDVVNLLVGQIHLRKRKALLETLHLSSTGTIGDDMPKKAVADLGQVAFVHDARSPFAI